jgi:hypothetical protein
MQINLEGKKVGFNPKRCKWQHQSAIKTQFAITSISGKKYFVKRQPRLFTGWFLLLMAHQNGNGLIRNTPKIVSIAKDTENYYFFTDYLPGDILENNTKNIDTRLLVGSIYDAVYTINKCKFWYSDLCTKNIFRSKDKFYLIDIDSAYPQEKLFKNDLHVSYNYVSLIVRYANETSPGQLNLANGHNGACVNQAMLVALAIDAKYDFAIPVQKSDIVMHTYLTNKHPELYQELFGKLVQGIPDWLTTKKLMKYILH